MNLGSHEGRREPGFIWAWKPLTVNLKRGICQIFVNQNCENPHGKPIFVIVYSQVSCKPVLCEITITKGKMDSVFAGKSIVCPQVSDSVFAGKFVNPFGPKIGLGSGFLKGHPSEELC